MSFGDMNGGAREEGPRLKWVMLLLLITTRTICLAQAPPTTLRIWGLAGPAQVLTRLEAGFARAHPEIRFEHHLYGQDSALGALSVGAADLAIMDRAPSYLELDGYQQAIQGETPLVLPLMVGGVTGGHSSPLVVVVSRSNPVDEIGLSQLAELFRAPAAGAVPLTWGYLGLKGQWSGRGIHLHGFPEESSEAATFSRAAMGDSKRWACGCDSDDRTPDASRAIVERVGKDQSALGITTLDALDVEVRVVPVIDRNGTRCYPAAEALRRGVYPLARTVSVLSRRGMDNGPESKVRSFLLYLRTREAQALIAEEGSYLFLDAVSQSDPGASVQ